MKVTNASINAPAFLAKFSVDDSLNILDKKRLSEIGAIIEKRTARYPEDIVSIGSAQAKEPIFVYMRAGDEVSCSTITKRGMKSLLELDNDTVATKFVNLFRVHATNNKIVKRAIKFLNFIEKNERAQKQKIAVVEKADLGIIKNINKLTDENYKSVIDNDSFFKNPDNFKFQDEDF